MSQRDNGSSLRTIALEEHYASPAFLQGPGHYLQAQVNSTQVLDRLLDLDERRIAEMDAAGIDMQVLSLISPGTEQIAASEAVLFAHETNDYLVAAVRHHPTRFAAFATLPTAAPQAAADELERTVHQYGFKGAMINGHIQGRYLDDQFFWPLLERAAEIQVPLYLHPTPPPQQVIQVSYTGNFSQEVTRALSTAGWGWHIETATHVLRLILSGVFDRYPSLQVIIGHLGEALPFMLPRIESIFSPQVTKLHRPISAYLRENLHYTISGFNFLPAFLDLLLEVGVERVMFSVDYPLASMEQARTFLDGLPISPSNKAQIAHRNAEHLLRL